MTDSYFLFSTNGVEFWAEVSGSLVIEENYDFSTLDYTACEKVGDKWQFRKLTKDEYAKCEEVFAEHDSEFLADFIDKIEKSYN